jgi:hypothetical protein
MRVARTAVVLVAWSALDGAGAANFERVQHSMHDGGISWGSGVEFNGVELQGSDGEEMEIDHDKITEDEIVDKKGNVEKNYLSGTAAMHVDTMANLPDVRGHGGIGRQDVGWNPESDKTPPQKSRVASSATGMKMTAGNKLVFTTPLGGRVANGKRWQ